MAQEEHFSGSFSVMTALVLKSAQNTKKKLSLLVFGCKLIKLNKWKEMVCKRKYGEFVEN